MEEKTWKGGIWGSIALILLGLSVIIGWWTNTEWLIQGVPSFTPMYFNIAILFVFLGIGSLFYLLDLRKIASTVAIVGGILAIVLFVERLLGIDWGLDHLFYVPSEKLQHEFHIGKCGLNTLFSFVCIFTSLFLTCRKNIKTIYLLLIGIFSGLSLAITIVAFWGYVSGMEAACSWSDLSRMAFFTAVGLAVASLLLLTNATKILCQIDKSVLPIWSAALVGMILFSTTLAFTKALAQHQTQTIRQTIESRVKGHAHALEDKMSNVTNALGRMGKRNLYQPAVPSREWKQDASNYLHDLDGLVGIVKLKENGEVVQKKWGVLVDQREIENDLESHLDEIVHAKEPSLYVAKFTTGPHLVYITPKGDGSSNHVAVISLDELLDELIPESQKNQTALQISVDGKQIYEIHTEDPIYKNLAVTDTIPLLNTEWKLTFWPTTKFIEREEGYFPVTAFLFGSVVSMFVATLTYLAQKSFEDSRLMSARNLARSAFLAQVSHELRTPLSGIIASVDILENTTDDPKQIRLLDIMRSSGQHLLSVINEVLDLAKLEAGKIPLEPSSQNVGEIAKDMISLLSPKAKEKGLLLTLQCDVPKSLIIDPTRLRQILSNLIGNAIKFTEKGGVTVEISYIHVLDKGKLQIEVEDSGIGISKEDQGHLFEKFSPVRKKNVEGTGLGLYITRAIVEIMGGTISFNSILDHGSVFTVILPVAPSEA